ncbi:hypothetical protein BIT28_02185 [Photobacterium proteolyticum]|uniref:Uncharacterized protein n=1 Tax=Photobacterium proteolyticum TaxID=1903952 RepID=A0A1Q9GVH7_9GAMM|nr:hypothetical protein [Photobacterium proteolyticum]OLQ79165.1 hypothetical protein BIT28_02185 [Photobacterium proteolyticum]
MTIVNVISNVPNVERYQPDACIDILWPCECYTVTLLANTNCELNFLESTVLQLCALELKDKTQIKDLLGLENELVDFVCDKLEQMCLIDERMAISVEGTTLLQKVKKQAVAPVTVNIYRNKITRQFLPMIIQPVTAQQCSSDNSEKLTFSIGNTGQQKKITAYHLSSDNRSVATGEQLTERTVLNIIERFKRLNRKNSLLSNIRSHRYPSQSQQIKITTEGEEVFIHCLAFIPKGDDEPMVCDGFFSSYDVDLTKAFKREYDLIKILKKSKKKFADIKSKELAKKRKQKITLQEHYQMISEEVVNDSFNRAKLEDKKTQYINSVYSLIETKFATLALQHRGTEWKEYFTRSIHQNGRVITEFAQQLGFTLYKTRNHNEVSHDKLVNPLFLVKFGSIKHLNAAQPEMKPALAMLLLSATLNDQHPFKVLAENHPDLLLRLGKLHHYRNSLSHGDLTILEQISKHELSKIHQLYISLVDGEDIEALVEHTTQPKWLQDDTRFRHREQLVALFGHYFIDHVDSDVLKQMEQALSTANCEDGRIRVNALAGALQQSLFIANTALINDDNKPKLVNNYLQIVQKCWGDALPENLLKTAENNIKRAVNGIDSTLGANLIVYLAHESEHNNNELKRLDSQLVNKIAKLISIRGHGGAVLGQQVELDNLEQTTFKFIHFLIESYCE